MAALFSRVVFSSTFDEMLSGHLRIVVPHEVWGILHNSGNVIAYQHSHGWTFFRVYNFSENVLNYFYIHTALWTWGVISMHDDEPFIPSIEEILGASYVEPEIEVNWRLEGF